MSLLGGVVALQRQAHQQLPATQIGPATGSRIQRIGEIIGLRHEMSRSSRGHPPECITEIQECYTRVVVRGRVVLTECVLQRVGHER